MRAPEAIAGLTLPRWTPIAAALVLPILAVACPPETEPWSRLACHLAAAIAILWIVLGDEGTTLGPSWIAWPLAFVAGAVLLAPCRSRAIDELADGLLLIGAAMAGRFLAGRPRAGAALALVLGGLGLGTAIDAMVQHHITYPAAAAQLQATQGSAAVLGILESGRPSGPFILPAALGGFLALAVPVTLALVVRGGRSGWRAAGVAALAAQAYALALTRSIGALIALAAGLLLFLAIHRPRHRRAIGAAVLLLAALGSAEFLLARRLEVEAATGNDPLTLRLGNWRAARDMIVEHPWFGVGPGSFGTAYPRVMRPGMNETRYAHNSYLQAAATWGLWILIPLCMLLAAFWRRARAMPATETLGAGWLAAGATFLVHNAGDFTAWLPGIAVPAALVLGSALAPPAQPPSRTEARPRGAATPLLRCAVLLIVALDLTHEMARARSSAAFREAVDAADHGDFERALRAARRAASARPGDPEPHALRAQIILDRLADSPSLRLEGEREMDRALALDPDSAILHYTRALFHQKAGEISAAYRERALAHRLYPLKPLYRETPAEGSGVPR